MDFDQIVEMVESMSPEGVLDAVLSASETARPCLTSSSQAEDIAVLYFLR
jgi:hypothetical protein